MWKQKSFMENRMKIYLNAMHVDAKDQSESFRYENLENI